MLHLWQEGILRTVSVPGWTLQLLNSDHSWRTFHIYWHHHSKEFSSTADWFWRVTTDMMQRDSAPSTKLMEKKTSKRRKHSLTYFYFYFFLCQKGLKIQIKTKFPSWRWVLRTFTPFVKVFLILSPCFQEPVVLFLLTSKLFFNFALQLFWGSPKLRLEEKKPSNSGGMNQIWLVREGISIYDQTRPVAAASRRRAAVRLNLSVGAVAALGPFKTAA